MAAADEGAAPAAARAAAVPATVPVAATPVPSMAPARVAPAPSAARTTTVRRATTAQASRSTREARQRARKRAVRASAPFRFGSVDYSRWYAKRQISRNYKWPSSEFTCLDAIYYRESRWQHRAYNPNGGAYGIPQSQPASKMAAAGADWRTNPETQIRWGLSYIRQVYRTPCRAWSFWQSHNWY